MKTLLWVLLLISLVALSVAAPQQEIPAEFVKRQLKKAAQDVIDAIKDWF
ncbi:hypothetical protein Bhyg_09020 [Pseudolycoriella hygida]|uniref:Uncharacterized protein n=1 Tax=Pseudolycoriella hygida TaxID=35572 RepID=A0A9Q0S428_9DIPT|nr:hypothetical protein Bhyg_09020 [Pseudolycoriella hygida]